MIDWWNVFTNSLWIVGLALALGVFGYVDWRTSQRGEGIRATVNNVLQRPSFIMGIAIACIGAGLGVPRWWNRLLWFLLAVGLAAWAGRVHANRQKAPRP